jgi:hypothetical protein
MKNALVLVLAFLMAGTGTAWAQTPGTGGRHPGAPVVVPRINSGDSICSTLVATVTNMWADGCVIPLAMFREWQTITLTYSAAPDPSSSPTVTTSSETVLGTGQCGVAFTNACPPTFSYVGPSINGVLHQFSVNVFNYINIPVGPVNTCWISTMSNQGAVSDPVVLCDCSGY